MKKGSFVNLSLLLGVLALTVISAGCGNDAYTADTFILKFNRINDTDSLVTLCRKYMDASIDEHERFTLARLVAQKWKEIDPDGVRAYLQEKHDENPVVVRYLFLMGEVADDPKARIDYARQVIELSPVWPNGYLLLTETYIEELFPLPLWDREANPLYEELRNDTGKFMSLSRFSPEDSWAYRPEYEFHLFAGDAEEAGRALAKAQKLEGDWVRPYHWARLYAHQKKDDKLREKAEEEVALRIQELQASKEHRKEAVEELIDELLWDAQRWKTLIRQYKQEADWRENPAALVELAEVYAAAGQPLKAVDHLEQAAGLGWARYEYLTHESVFDLLHKNPRWDKLVAQVRGNWERTSTDRRIQTHNKRISRAIRDWYFTTAQGDTISAEHLFGKIAVLNFWTPRCETCVEAILPVVDSLAVQYQDEDDVVVYAVRIWDKGIALHKRHFQAEEYTVTPLFATPRQSAVFPIKELPYTCVLDREGRIRYELDRFYEGTYDMIDWMVQSLK